MVLPRMTKFWLSKSVVKLEKKLFSSFICWEILFVWFIRRMFRMLRNDFKTIFYYKKPRFKKNTC